MSALQNWARLLGGEVSGRQILAPGPNHSAHDRSLSVRIDASAPDGFLAFSHAGDDWRACRDYVKGRLGTANVAHAQLSPAPAKATHAPLSSTPDTTAAALRIWREARKPGK